MKWGNSSMLHWKKLERSSGLLKKSEILPVKWLITQLTVSILKGDTVFRKTFRTDKFCRGGKRGGRGNVLLKKKLQHRTIDHI